MNDYAKNEIIAEIKEKLRLSFGSDISEASPTAIFKSAALVMRDIMASKLVDAELRSEKSGARHIHYLSMEFLLGRSLEKNAFNLGVLDIIGAALRDLGFEPADLFEVEPDAALGNGGLGRLAACYLEAMTTMGLPATGYTLLYEYGIFKQKIVDCEQTELPDKWLDIDDVWLLRSFSESYDVRFGGNVDYDWIDDKMIPVYNGSTVIRAVPADMPISGFNNDVVNRLRLWSAQATSEMDMDLFSQGQYLKAVEERAMAEVITKLLYPGDNHYEGKMLRLRQQYFFVSATVQNIVSEHFSHYGTLDNFAEKHIMQINDTHPTFVIPELMRILLDEHDYGWDEAWKIVKNSVAYTNHTVLSEALEVWPQNLVKTLVPRVYDIIQEIHRRYELEIEVFYGPDPSTRQALSILYDGQVRMANLCVAACRSVNGVSALHTEILKDRVFHDAYSMNPKKFVNVTNGIDHRRWLAQTNPALHALISDLIGDSYLTDAERLEGLNKFTGDATVLARLDEIKLENKLHMAEIIRKTNGISVDPNSIFDVQAKRLHEYKRQLLNVLHILHLHNRLINDPSFNIRPQTFIFAAKSAASYVMAKRIIKLINRLGEALNNDSRTNDRIRVVFLENYRVSLAEKLMPASELSEQISLAGLEASGTGNMKFMMNGALTIGTMDGANVEICEQAGRENMFIFGMSAEEAAELTRNGYNPLGIYDSNHNVRRAIDIVRAGFGGESFGDIAQSLLLTDTYRLLADFDSYCGAQELARETYGDRVKWNRMALTNIAGSGFFAADRSVGEYAKKIWMV